MRYMESIVNDCVVAEVHYIEMYRILAQFSQFQCCFDALHHSIHSLMASVLVPHRHHHRHILVLIVVLVEH